MLSRETLHHSNRVYVYYKSIISDTKDVDKRTHPRKPATLLLVAVVVACCLVLSVAAAKKVAGVRHPRRRSTSEAVSRSQPYDVDTNEQSDGVSSGLKSWQTKPSIQHGSSSLDSRSVSGEDAKGVWQQSSSYLTRGAGEFQKLDRSYSSRNDLTEDAAGAPLDPFQVVPKPLKPELPRKLWFSWLFGRRQRSGDKGYAALVSPGSTNSESSQLEDSSEQQTMQTVDEAVDSSAQLQNAESLDTNSNALIESMKNGTDDSVTGATRQTVGATTTNTAITSIFQDVQETIATVLALTNETKSTNGKKKPAKRGSHSDDSLAPSSDESFTHSTLKTDAEGGNNSNLEQSIADSLFNVGFSGLDGRGINATSPLSPKSRKYIPKGTVSKPSKVKRKVNPSTLQALQDALREDDGTGTDSGIGIKWVPKLKQVLVLYSDRAQNDTDVTIATHLTLERISSLRVQCTAWPSVIAAALYIPTVQHKVFSHQSTWLHRNTLPNALRKVAKVYDELQAKGPCKLDLSVYTEDVPALSDLYSYPINAMRNRALRMTQTKVVLQLDIDTTVGSEVGPALTSADEYGHTLTTLEQKELLVFPAFDCVGKTLQERKMVLPGVLAGGKDRVVEEWDKGRLEPYAGNITSSTQYSKWRDAVQQYKVELEDNPQYAPHVIGLRHAFPEWDERLRAGFEHTELYYFHLAKLGYTFWVHPVAYLVHMAQGGVDDVDVDQQQVEPTLQKFQQDIAQEISDLIRGGHYTPYTAPQVQLDGSKRRGLRWWDVAIRHKLPHTLHLADRQQKEKQGPVQNRWRNVVRRHARDRWR